MNRTGVVIQKKGNRAVVELSKTTACGDCGACHLGDESKNISIECDNVIGADIGEKVEVDLAFNEVMSAAFIMYTIPLLALLVGVFGGQYLYAHFVSETGSELVAGVCGFVLLGLSYVLIRKNDANFAKQNKYLSKIVQIHNRTQILTSPQMNVNTSNFAHHKLNL